MTLEADVQKGWHSAIVEMFDIDLTAITGDPEDIFYFTNQLKPDETKIQWKGHIYEALPLLSSGYETNTTGQIAQPVLTVANIFGTFTDVIKNLEDLVGGKVTRRRTFAKYLDGEPEADTLQEFPIDVYYIERKTEETALSITWQLSSVMDLEGLQLPRRVITQNHCLWRYRSSECGYTGAPVFNSNDEVISTSGLSAEAAAVVNAWTLNEQRKAEYKNAVSVRNKAFESQQNECNANVKIETKYSRTAPLSYSTGGLGLFFFRFAYWNGVLTSLNQFYRQGILRETTTNGGKYQIKTSYYEIERWGGDPARCAAAGAVLAAADVTLATATSNYNASQAGLSAALAALPALMIQCGILTCVASALEAASCTSQSNLLPYGVFPGANLSR
jgi:lambda family phage minor tail protein L